MTISVEITRKKDDGINTIGEGVLIRDGLTLMTFKTLELAYRDNRKRVSAIPIGRYTCKRHFSPKFGLCWKVMNVGKDEVDKRSQILIHPANYASSDSRYKSDLKGCIAFGMKHGDLNQDGVIDLIDSRLVHKQFDKHLKNYNEFELVIDNDF